MSNATSMEQDRSDLIAMIHDSVEAFVPTGADLKRIRPLRYAAPGFDRSTWREICGLGWVGLRVPEAEGGSGLGLREFCVVAEGLGVGLVPEPLIPCGMTAELLGGDTLADVLSGERIIVPAWQERPHSLDVGASTQIHGGRVTGRKVFVPMAGGADAFLVATADALALVERDAPGVTLMLDTTQDGGQFGTLALSDAPAQPVVASAEAVAAALDHATLATAAYLLGVTERAFAITLDYLKVRKQFGRLIGSFQALQHRAVDLRIQISLLRASVESAAATLDAAPSPALRQAVVSRAKARAAEVSMMVNRQAIQLHGAIAYTDEYDVGLYLRKAMTLANLYGSADVHRARYARVSAGLDEA
jgi:alkylation response protein AidB-like acyl-CoA dehydrogenase